MTETILPSWLLFAVAAVMGVCSVYLIVKGVISASKGTKEALISAAFYLFPAGLLLMIAALIAS